MDRILVTGATGFVGSSVARACVARPGLDVRLGTRSPGNRPGAETVRLDVTDGSSLARALDGVDVVVHAASYVGPSAERAREVNGDGTARLVRVAERAGVRRVVYAGTAAVYGHRPVLGAGVEDLVPRPRSALSATRLAAEEAVRAAGGLVARPYLVHGRGDRWFRCGVARLFGRLGGVLDGPGTLLSTVDVDALGRALVMMALAPDGVLPPGSAWHANHPEPRSLCAVAAQVLPGIDRHRVPLPVARRMLGDDPVARHHLAMLAGNRWYGSRPLWRVLGLDPGPSGLV